MVRQPTEQQTSGLDDPVNRIVSNTKLRVLGTITDDEKTMLRLMNDPVEVISYWRLLSLTKGMDRFI